MSFTDDAREHERPTLMLYRCRRCSELVTERHADATVALRRAVETGAMVTLHECDDGAGGVCELVGTGPGRPRETSPREEVPRCAP